MFIHLLNLFFCEILPFLGTLLCLTESSYGIFLNCDINYLTKGGGEMGGENVHCTVVICIEDHFIIFIHFF
jgi:hypothetical protein